jgi:hypothetical protein
VCEPLDPQIGKSEEDRATGYSRGITIRMCSYETVVLRHHRLLELLTCGGQTEKLRISTIENSPKRSSSFSLGLWVD